MSRIESEIDMISDQEFGANNLKSMNLGAR
jgi:hypothetical protein